MLQVIIDWVFYSLLGLSETRLVSSLDFFIYDSIKILILLFGMIFVIGFLRTYISQARIKAMLSHGMPGVSNLVASLFGAITPFCSCSSIPIFLGFLKSGVPIGVAFSFLITSPLINEYLVVIMLGLFGWKITLAYILSGLVLGTVLGLVLGKIGVEKHISKDFQILAVHEEVYRNIQKRLLFGLHEAKDITKKLWAWILLGVGVGALIHNYIPESFIQGIISKGGIFTVPIATLLGVPMYGSCAAIVPIALALFDKGVPIGTAIAFMMATAALSLPEAIILRRAINLKLIGMFFGVVAAGIVFSGYLLNALSPLLV